jgi:hypothetical protein
MVPELKNIPENKSTTEDYEVYNMPEYRIKGGFFPKMPEYRADSGIVYNMPEAKFPGLIRDKSKILKYLRKNRMKK